MSKKQYRKLNINFRNCPCCGSKNIRIFKFRKFFKNKLIIECFCCDKNTLVEEIIEKKEEMRL